ncbi:hypothetical protein [Chryseobacterium sp. T1]
MKKLTSIILITAFSVASAQKISDYEYIYVPKELDKKINNYKLDQLLIKNLNSKKYKTFQDSQDNWPTDLQLNKCLVAKANIIDDSSFLKNKIKIQFKDCNDKIISESKGASNEKDYDLGYPDALRQAFPSIPVSNPSETKAIADTPSPTTTTTNTVSNSKSETYSNNSLSLQKINIGAGQFILANANSSVPFATLKESTKHGVYHVKLENGSSTIAYIENENIVIEIPQSNDAYKKEVFLKK